MSRPDDPAVAARDEHMRRSAIRALDDPKVVARAVRIIRAGLERQLLTVDDILPDGGGNDRAA
jgi:hypothetical protein